MLQPPIIITYILILFIYLYIITYILIYFYILSHIISSLLPVQPVNYIDIVIVIPNIIAR